MKPLVYVGYGLCGIVAMACVTMGMLIYFDVLSPDPEPLVVDAKVVTKMFVDHRGKDLDEDAYRLAIRDIDSIVTAEAERIYRATGQVMINADHILAGGRDVSVTFGERVIELWDQTQ